MPLCDVKIETPDVAQAPETLPVEAQVNPMRVLVAEDNKFNQMLVEEMLSTFGVTPLIANNGIEAVEAVAQAPFDLILMDINMPEMSGIDALHQIRSSGDTTPVIALTANAMEGDEEHLLSLRITSYNVCYTKLLRKAITGVVSPLLRI